MKNLKKIITNGLILSTLVSSAMAQENLYFWEQKSFNPLQENCEWRYEGCVSVDENQIDMRSQAKRMLDEIYSCKNTIQGCSEEEQRNIDEMEGIKGRIGNETIRGGMNPKEFSEFLRKYDPSDNKKGYFIPLGLSDKEALMLAASTSLGLVMFASDEETMDFIQDHKNGFTEKLVYPTNNHERLIMGGAAAGSYFMGVVLEDGKLKKAGLYVVTSQIATQIVTEGFKKTFGRQRPNKDLGAYEFGTEGKSFFSGHSSGAWSFATVFAEIYKDNKVVPYLAYGVAALTSYGRLHDRKHWLSDVFAGAIAGHLITKLVIRMHESDDSQGGLMVFPSWNAESGTFMVNFEWTPKRKNSQGEFECKKMPEGKEKIRACIYEAYLRSQN
ncbi:phosphatase PAP2 family protein [Halobacteriovorax sp. DA5]|uniref:phosphatase PAP2 family protein n=1 Tax=Halobacteriovorax sp. DA5 TaxID=2067553 RepID=UPI000CD2DC02|nr:phosphatase PAP2 family protein [Halobacteriovorax sp. DA5]POB15194.1 hypothetical protein C0Z22_02085 [Halobacteriovorax sp. DA5]